MRAELGANARIARYVGDGFAAQVAKAYNEITGQSFPDRRAEADAERDAPRHPSRRRRA